MAVDLNDYVLFAEVVAHGGFAAAGRALRQPKSTLSRRIAALETRLGVRLIERSTRRFRVTEVGQAFHERCRLLMLDAQQADAVVAEALSEPHGLVRCSCPVNLVETLSPIFLAYMRRYPRVRLQIVATDRPIDLIAERVDLAIRVRLSLETDAALTLRTLGGSTRILVADPELAQRCDGRDLATLADLPTLSPTDQLGELEWELIDAEGEARTVRHTPRMTCGDYAALREAAAAGLGVALLPDHACRDLLASGRLVRVFPDWSSRVGIVHVVFTTRRGLPPAVRALIDQLAEAFRRGGLTD